MTIKAQKNTFWRNLFIRFLAALILIPVVIYPVMMGGAYLKALLIMVTLLLGYEYAKLTQLSDKTKAIFTAGVFMTIWWLFAMNLREGFIDGILVMAIAAVTVMGSGVILKKHRMCWSGFGVAYICIPMFSLALIALHPNASAWLTWMLVVVWANDTGAYLSGKAIGGPKYAPAISPNKTWAGVVGGVVFATVAGFLMVNYMEMGNLIYLAFAAALLAVWAQLGDLAESLIKRKFGAKDSGSLIPGHGGILDRVDALLFAAPALALALELKIL